MHALVKGSQVPLQQDAAQHTLLQHSPLLLHEPVFLQGIDVGVGTAWIPMPEVPEVGVGMAGGGGIGVGVGVFVGIKVGVGKGASMHKPSGETSLVGMQLYKAQAGSCTQGGFPKMPDKALHP